MQILGGTKLAINKRKEFSGPIPVNVWAGVIESKIIGPILFQEQLTRIRYSELIFFNSVSFSFVSTAYLISDIVFHPIFDANPSMDSS